MNLISPKTKYIELPANDDGIILCSLVSTQYRHCLGHDRNATAGAARCKTVEKKNEYRYMIEIPTIDG